jgi:Domain of Unknown Function (DUF1259)
MSQSKSELPITRRTALALGGGTAAGLLLPSGLAQGAGKRGGPLRQSGRLPSLAAMEKILHADGEVSEGLAHFSIDRDDAEHVKGPMGVEFSGSFEINGDLYFQPLRGGKLAFLNGDVPLKPEELNPFIDALLANGLTFQAMHQHYFDLDPMYWFIHFRGVAAPLALAKAVKAALDVTAIPFPQKGPERPSTPFDAKRLAKILHGTATVGEEGVVTVDVSRKGRIVIEGVEVNTDANLSTDIQFKPHGKAKDAAVAGPDFSMTSSEVTPVISLMRGAGWQVHCLYNQETAESPQLYFSHMLKTGDVYELAAEIRQGLDLTHAD